MALEDGLVALLADLQIQRELGHRGRQLFPRNGHGWGGEGRVLAIDLVALEKLAWERVLQTITNVSTLKSLS